MTSSSSALVDAGGGWLIFALPPAELGRRIRPKSDGHHELYLMCDDINATVAELRAKGVEFTKEISDQGFGLPSPRSGSPAAASCGLYEPRHPTAISPGG